MHGARPRQSQGGLAEIIRYVQGRLWALFARVAPVQ